jgi:hypothetical protein
VQGENARKGPRARLAAASVIQCMESVDVQLVSGDSQLLIVECGFLTFPGTVGGRAYVHTFVLVATTPSVWLVRNDVLRIIDATPVVPIPASVQAAATSAVAASAPAVQEPRAFPAEVAREPAAATVPAAVPAAAAAVVDTLSSVPYLENFVMDMPPQSTADVDAVSTPVSPSSTSARKSGAGPRKEAASAKAGVESAAAAATAAAAPTAMAVKAGGPMAWAAIARQAPAPAGATASAAAPGNSFASAATVAARSSSASAVVVAPPASSSSAAAAAAAASKVSAKPAVKSPPREINAAPTTAGASLVTDGSCSVYVSGVPVGTAQNDLRNAFSRFGVITNVNISRAREGDKSGVGFAHVDFATQSERDACVNVETVTGIDGTLFRVRRGRPKPQHSPRAASEVAPSAAGATTRPAGPPAAVGPSASSAKADAAAPSGGGRSNRREQGVSA